MEGVRLPARPVAQDLLPGEGGGGGSVLPRGWVVATGSLVAAAEVLDAWLDACGDGQPARHRGWVLLTHALGHRLQTALARVLHDVAGALPDDVGPPPAIVVLGRPVTVAGADLRALRRLPSLLASPLDARLASCLRAMGDLPRTQLLDDVRTAVGLLEPRPSRPALWRDRTPDR